MKKVTYTLDEETLAWVDRLAERLSKAKSQVVREAIRFYGQEMGRLSQEERERMLGLFDEVTAGIPTRPRGEVEKELAEVREARRVGGRGGAKELDR